MTASQRAYGGRRTAQGGEVDASTVIARSMTERDLSQHVVNLARMLGWLVHRDPTWRATGTDAGYPDLTLVHPEHERLVFAELKREGGSMTDAQKAWYRALYDAAWAKENEPPAFIVTCWWPSDWLSGHIERVLRGEG
ncbi:MAG: VRR-NUC domain-containing protein [Patescibacteria group bacterium]|nr:VRR-NUC domain-containing protein [Patescibacteria group bacterium]